MPKTKQSLASSSSSSLDSQAESDVKPSDIDSMSIKGQEPGFKNFLKTVVGFSGDLSALTSPSYFLNGLSLTEYSAYWADHPDLLAMISKEKDPAERMLAVTRWFMSSLYGSYWSRCDKGQSEKKPYNPILGEQFLCKVADTGYGETNLICEQVSHHPPIMAFFIENQTAGISLNGHNGQKSKFKGTSIKVEQTGRVHMRIKDFDEEMQITYPDIWIRSLFTGSPYLELSGASTITSTSGFTATIEFIPKPWLGGELHHIKGRISHHHDNKEVYYFSGKWNAISYYHHEISGPKKQLFDAASPTAERIFAPLEEQSDYQTHKVWGACTNALLNRDFDKASAEKSKIEESQRTLRKERTASGEAWTPKYFTFVVDDKEGAIDDNSGNLNADGTPTEARGKRSNIMRNAVSGAGGLGDGAWVYRPPQD